MIQGGTATNIDVTLSHQQEVREVVDVVESPPVGEIFSSAGPFDPYCCAQLKSKIAGFSS